MRTSPSILLPESTGYSECLDRLSASGGVQRPLATYRLQFNAGFKFDQAAGLLDYLQALGITDCYASPVLTARAGSTHGYDITDHNRINPELGGQQEFHHFTAALKQRGMGLVLDLVANHVGVNQGDNRWWHDVLENGRTSEFADYFDIDWAPLKPELHGKLLLPVLGGQYGEELEGGNLQLGYDDGTFHVAYFDKRFPLDPQSYPLIFDVRARRRFSGTRDETALPPELDLKEFRSLLSEFGELPPHSSEDPDEAQFRRRRVAELRRRLSRLLAAHPALMEYVQRILERVNGVPGDSRSFDTLHRLLDAQAYRLAHWRVSAEEINYRRFFDINDLVGLRMENPRVFASTHQLIRRLLAEGSITGLRIDHPDGMLNPNQYFVRLQMLYCAAHCAGAVAHPPLAENGIESDFQEIFGRHDWIARRPPLYVIVEKILQPGESLPTEWPVDGTVGYEFAALTTSLFVQSRNQRAFTNLYRRFTGDSSTPEEVVYAGKRLIMGTALPSEINVLTHMLADICSRNRRARDFTLHSLRNAIREIIACFPVYRTYIDERGNVSERDRLTIQFAAARAKRRNQSMPASIFDFVRDILLLKDPGPSVGADARHLRLAFALKFQQLTGPVMAKGLEDTAFYVYNRFIALNEVGGSPARFGIEPAEFHHANLERAEHWPNSMLATSTHDTKRSEDVRMRLDVLSEMPAAWSAQVHRWRRMTRMLKPVLADGRAVPDANEEYFLYQTLVGATPLELQVANPDSEQLTAYRERIRSYIFKAVHEAKRNLSWVNPDPEYIAALERFLDAILAPPASKSRSGFWQDLARFLPPISYFGCINSLAQLLLKIASPGVPDIYGGNEVWDFSLVDPDNRRPVDFGQLSVQLQDLLTRAGSGSYAQLCSELLERWQDGGIKMWVAQRGLAFRREHPELFREGSYLPLEPSGSKAEHVIAFARRHEQLDQTIIVAAPRFSYSLMRGQLSPPLAGAWEETAIRLPRAAPNHFLNIFTGEIVAPSNGSLLCREVFGQFPVALLVGR